MTTTTTAKALTIAHLKAFDRHSDTKRLRAELIAAMSNAKATRAKVDAYIAPVFARFSFTDKRTGEKITKPGDLYRSNDDAKCAEFYKACTEAHRANGYNIPEEYCPACMAEEVERKAKHALLMHATKLVGSVVGVDFANTWDLSLRAKAVDLFLNPPRL